MRVDSAEAQEESKVGSSGGGMHSCIAGDIPTQLYVCTTCNTPTPLQICTTCDTPTQVYTCNALVHQSPEGTPLPTHRGSDNF